MVSLDDKTFMKRAIKLALRGGGWVNPNPLVGCVIVKADQVIGQGWHMRFGCPHAEREALADCVARGNSAEGASVYVTLEPCSHFGKTPPCVDALIEAKVARVVVGSTDPNPEVSGRGIKALRDAGICVEVGVCADECDALNDAFFHWIQTSRPLVIAKYAMTLDGKIATRTGHSRWITGEHSRARVHKDRSRYAAVMVGIGTVLADDPLLNARPLLHDRVDVQQSDTCNAFGASGVSALPDAFDVCDKPDSFGIHQPTRIICDTHLRTPLDSALVKSAHISPVLIATCVRDVQAHEPYKASGCGILFFEPDANGRIPLAKLFDELGRLGIDSVIVEGGSALLGSVFDEGLADVVQAYVAFKIFGGKEAASPVGGMGVSLPSEAFTMNVRSVEFLGDDILIEARKCLQE